MSFFLSSHFLRITLILKDLQDYTKVISPEIKPLAREKRLSIPVVFSAQEANSVISNMQGTTQLMIILMYGSGLRTAEVCSLRVKDIDFDMKQIVVREGKGLKDRVTLLQQGYDRFIAPTKPAYIISV